MMKFEFNVEDRSGLDYMLFEWPRNSRQIVADTCNSIVERTKQNIIAVGAVATGYMLSQVNSQVIDSNTGEVTVDTDYAEHVELGSQGRPPRPFLEPAFVEEQSEFESRIGHKLGGI